jgi:hypothetical protein
MGGKSTSTSDPKINQLAVQSSSLGLPITLGWGRGRLKCNLIWYQAFAAIPHTTKQSGGKGLGGKSTNTTYSYTASVIMGLCEGPVQGVRTVYRDKDVYQDHVTTLSWDGVTYGTTTQTALQQAGLSLALGAVAQSPWGYATSLYPAQALGYSEIAYVYAQDYALNDSASMPNHSFEVDFAIQIAGLPDANPKDIISDFLTNSAHGVPGWASGLLGDLTDWSNYCLANNLLLSPVLEEQSSASDVLTEWTEATNSAAFWSEGVLKIATFGDAGATANGVTWTPNLSPDYDLTEDDFLPGDDAPVQLEIVDQSDAYNVVQVEFLDRANQYNVAIATADDNANITAFGQRKQDSTQYHCIADAAIARHSAQLLLQRTLYRRDIYRFKLPWNFVLLEPMDYITLTTTTDELQLYRQLVQIVSIDEDEDGLLSFTAEGINIGAASAALYHSHSGSAVTVNTSVAPGSVTAPILINAPSALTGMDPEVWCAVSAPSAAWGGCEVWASADNVHFQKVGRVDGPARVGVTTAALADNVDPDTTHTLSVDLSACAKTLDGTTAANANAGSTLIYVGGELMGYQTATLTSAYHYNLTTLRRGLYGTAHAAHASGTAFARLDDAVFRFGYTSLNVGTTIYLKFPSFNVFGAAPEDISTVATYSLALLDSAHAIDWRVIADDAVSDAAAAQAAADAANAELADIASDGLLTPDEKPRIIYDRDIITGEQAGIDAQATSFGIATEKTAYDGAITALTTYLAGLTTPVLWSNLSGNTTIVGATFRTKFSDVYSARQTLLNKIAAVAKARGDQGVTDAAAAQSSANAAASAATTAQSSANAALSQISNIVANNLLDKSEKPQVVADYNLLLAEQSGIDAQALAYGITAEKTNYDNGLSALTTYLTGLSPAYNSYTTDTAITRSTFISTFQTAYTAKTALLNAIAAKAGTLAAWAGVSGAGKPADNATQNVDGANMIPDPLGFTGGALLNGAVYATLNASGRPVERKAIQLAFGANALGQFGPRIPVIPGETLYLQYVVKSDGGTTESCNASYSYFDAAGGALGAVNLSGATSRTLASVSSAWTIVQTSFAVPSTAAAIIVYVERPAFTGFSFFIGEPFLGRAQPGSTIGAPAGTPVASISANDVASTVKSGGGLNVNQVDTLSVQAGALVLRPVVQLASSVSGSGSSFGTVLTYSLVLAQAAKIVLSATGQHSYSGGTPDHGGAFRVNGGAEFGGTAGGSGTAIPGFAIGTTISLAAGTHTIDLRWRGGTSQITLYDAIMNIDTAMRAL